MSFFQQRGYEVRQIPASGEEVRIEACDLASPGTLAGCEHVAHPRELPAFPTADQGVRAHQLPCAASLHRPACTVASPT